MTVHRNGTATSLVVTIPADSAAAVLSDTSHQIPFAQGDKLGLEIVNNASTSSGAIMGFSCEFAQTWPPAFAS